MVAEPTTRRLLVTADDVAAFARASGDRNPLHLDPEFAADTAFGGCIAHGALVALCMLGALPDAYLRDVRSLRLLFPAPVLVGEPLELTVAAGAEACELRGQVRGKAAVRVLARSTPLPLEALPPGTAESQVPFRFEPVPTDQARLRPGSTICGEYATAPELSALAGRLGAAGLHPALLQGLAWSSYVVGMEIPGMHSLFAGLTLTTAIAPRPAAPADGQAGKASAPGNAKFAVSVRSHDERSGRVVMTGMLSASSQNAATATIDCFAIPARHHPDLDVLSPSEPAVARGEVALIGCSRGFGASLALALLARGYDVRGTYRSSPTRASELAGLAASVVRRADPAAGRLTLEHCDAADPQSVAEFAAHSAGRQPLAGLVLGAALPPLGMALGAGCGRGVAEYVAASVALATVPLDAFIDRLDDRLGWILICSSAAMNSPPREWPHYVAAKGALEGLAHWLATTRPNLRTVLARLPKMTTSMTATPSGRIGATSPDLVAAWAADRLAARELAAGLTVLDPEREAVLA